MEKANLKLPRGKRGGGRDWETGIGTGIGIGIGRLGLGLGD